IEDGDAIEIYGIDSVQLYRNLTFFRTCGFSLLDLTVLEWYRLWARPQFVVDRIAAFVSETLAKGPAIRRFEIPTHIVKEVHQSSLDGETRHSRAISVDLRWLVRLQDERTGEPGGIAVVCRGAVVAEGFEAEKI